MSEGKRPVCGVIMPISHVDSDHTEEHWEKVKEIIFEAITEAGCNPQPVWEGGSHDIIQTQILQNIFENTIVVCDLSTKNPNVMLEIGMRLTTKKPTILIAEKGTKLPFDTSIFHTEFYDKSLEFNPTKRFIERLSEGIVKKNADYLANDYHPYIESFTFETVEPSKVSVTSEEHLAGLVERMESLVRKVESGAVEAEYDIWSDALRNSILKKQKQDALNKYLAEVSALPEKKIKEGLLAKYMLPMLKVGDSVEHEKFGRGEIVLIDGQKAGVNFENVGLKKIILEFLKPSD